MHNAGFELVIPASERPQAQALNSAATEIGELPSMPNFGQSDIFINCNWVVARWQYTFTHKQYIEQHK